MDKTMQSSLCKGLRACGLPKAQTYEILNTIVKWYDGSGPEWTNQRLKDLKQWYESILSGRPEPPAWFKHNKEGYPIGAFNRLFKCRKHSKVLAILSANTLFVNRKISEAQKTKFIHGLEGNAKEVDAHKVCSELEASLNKVGHFVKMPKAFPCVELPSSNDMTATVIPLGGRDPLRLSSPSSVEERRWALIQSWDTVPEVTLEYLDDIDHLDWIPIARLVNGQDFTFSGEAIVGKIGFIQEPGLKLRTVANPNRVSQAFTKPLASVWETIMVSFPSDCTFNQDSGVRWAQQKLSEGVCLSGSDLSSATDLLDLDVSLLLAKYWVKRLCGHWSNEDWIQYEAAVKHFSALSRAPWRSDELQKGSCVSWKQGQPLGLYPSFRLLALVNNSAGLAAAEKCGLDPWDSFRVIGDDIIMKAEMEPIYSAIIESIGGEINHSKTLTSNRVAEFAGRIIEPKQVSRKTYRFRDPGDNSFFDYVSDLGPQALGLLRPRQRRMWEYYKYVPGVAVDGPWSKDSFGEPLVSRLSWFLTDSALPFPPSLMTEEERKIARAAEPQPTVRDTGLELLYTQQQALRFHGLDMDSVSDILPYPMVDDYLSSEFREAPNQSGDPRRKSGKTHLEVLEQASKESRPYRVAIKPKPVQPEQPESSDRVIRKATEQARALNGARLGKGHGNNGPIR